MKKFWKKIPAWLKAVLLNILLLYPMMLLVQGVLVTNVNSLNTLPWSVPFALLMLFGFYHLVKKKFATDEPQDVSIKFWFDSRRLSNWSYTLAIFFLTPALIMLVAFAFEINDTEQRQFILSFGELEAWVAVPILITLAFSAGIIEELTYRACLQNTLTRVYPKGISFLVMGVIFALLHFLPL